MNASYRAGWLAAAMGGDNLCRGGGARKQAQYRAGHAAFLARIPGTDDAAKVADMRAGFDAALERGRLEHEARKRGK